MLPWPAIRTLPVAALCGMAGFGLLQAAQAHESHAATGTHDETAQVELGEAAQQQSGIKTILLADAARSTALPGLVVVDARRDLRIVARQDGVIEAPAGGFAQPGQKVIAGQVLAYLRPALPQPERRNLEIEYAAAHRDAMISRLQVERYQLDGTQPFDIKLPTPTLQLLADYRSAQARESQLHRALNDGVTIAAPRAGVVVRSNARAGAVAVSGQSLFELNAGAGLAIAVEYSDRDIDSAQVKSAVTVDGQSIGLSLLSESYDPELRSRRALYEVVGAIASLAPGEPVQVRAETQASSARQFALPARSVFRQDGASWVWVNQRPGIFRAQRIHYVATDQERILVDRGLSGSEHVVVDGVPALNDARRAEGSRP